MVSMLRLSRRTPKCRFRCSIGVAMMGHVVQGVQGVDVVQAAFEAAMELDAFCIVRVLFFSGTCHARTALSRVSACKTPPGGGPDPGISKGRAARLPPGMRRSLDRQAWTAKVNNG